MRSRPAPVKPNNPPIQVTLDKVGVHDNGEGAFRAVNPAQSYANIVGKKADASGFGEVYVYLVVTDGKATREFRLPSKEGQYYQLKPDDAVTINKRLLYTSEVGDSLTITAVGYEADGGGFEQVINKALELAIESQVGSTGILERFNVNLGDLIRKFTGAEHDFLGSYEKTFSKADNWGIGTHYIPCQVNGVTCLKLWFTIDSPN